jgi:hypothetical protein
MVSMRSNLLRIITRWEQIGQGKGEQGLKEDEATNNDTSSSLTSQQADDDTRSIGVLTGKSPQALQSRALFLNGHPSYLLYFWEVANSHQVLQSLLQRVNNQAGASDA